MIPKVLDWDARYASAEERILATEANRKSGLKALQGINYNEALKAA
jgi:alkane 1-monooxygenase